VRRFFRIIYYIGGVLLFITVAVIGYTQTRSFKKYLQQTLLRESQSVLNVQLRFGRISGNLITGFTIDSVSLAGPADEPFSTERIQLKYDLFGFLFNRIAISNAVLVKPRIHIYRSVDGSWNISNLIKPTPDDTLPSTWVIDIKKVELQDAELIFIDSLLLYRRQIGDSVIPPDSVVDYARIHLFELSLDASARIEEGKYEGTVRSLKFLSHEPSFLLKNFEGDFFLSRDKVSARDVRIETTNSLLRIDAALMDVHLASLSKVEDLKTKPVTLSVSADGIDTRELKQFLYPSVDFLDRILKLHLKASGTFGDMKIEQLAVQMPHSSVNLQGQLRNLHAARNLEMTVHADENVVAPRDLLECFPGLHIPDLTFLGPCKFSFTYEGRPLDFKALVSASTQAGSIDIDGGMKITPEDVRYSGSIKLQSASLGVILQNEKISSDLYARMTVDGTGFDPRTMTGLARIEIDSSSLIGLPLQRSVVVFDVADGIVRSHFAASLGSGTYELSSTLNLFRQDSSSYTINGKFRSLDLAELLKNKQYESDLSFDLTAAGWMGKGLRSDTAAMNFYRSAFQTQRFESAEAKAVYHANENLSSHLQVTSSIGDLVVDGRFTPGSFVAAWKNSYQLITEAIGYRFRNLDSLQSSGNADSEHHGFQPSHISTIVPTESQFHFLIKDFKPIGAFLQVPMNGQGSIDGMVAGDSAALSLRGKVMLEQFGLRAGTDTLTADSAGFQYAFGGVNAQTMFETFNASVETNLKNFTLNNFLFNQFSGRLQVQSDSSQFHFTTFIDSTAHVTIEGTSKVHAGFMEFIIPELHTEIAQFNAENEDTVRLSLGCDGFRISALTMTHESEEAVLSGSFSPTGLSDIQISLNGFLLSNLKQILHRGPYGKSSIAFGGRVDASTSFRGSFENPNIVVELKADGVRAEDALQNKSQVFGKVESRLAYYRHMLNVLVKFMSRPDDPNALPDLLLSGSLPYEFVLAREVPHKLSGQVDLTLKAAGLDLKYLDPFVPEVSNLSGMLKCDMRMEGPFDAPLYEGSMSIQQAGLVFDPLGIRYILNGDLIPAGDRIQLERFTIQNDPMGGKPQGTMRVTGNFTLLGLKLKQFDIVAQGDLKVMTEEKRFAGQKLYGDLFAATGPNGIIWRGDLSSSLVRGEVYVKDAQLILPPERETELVRASVVQITFHDDTSKNVYDIHQESMVSNGNMKSVPAGIKTTNGSTIASSQLHESAQNSFLDGINYDVGIETKGPTTLRFVFNTQTREELYADLQGRLYFYKTPEMSRLTGQVEVGNRSYYNFIKKFEATGKLLFTGDILNPELDVTGTYQGIHRAIVQTNSADTSYHNTSKAENEDEQVLVTLRVTGTRNEPKTKISLQTKTYSEKDWINWEDRENRTDGEANAITFILSNQFRDELTDQQRMGLIGTNLGLALASGMVMGPLSDAIRRSTWGYIQSVDVIYAGGQFNESADLRLTGQVGETVIRMGGRVLNDLSNTNVSVELPVSSIVNSERYRNLILTLERRVEGIQNVEEQRRASNGARLFYRIIF
jgi:hypothetical protein